MKKVLAMLLVVLSLMTTCALAATEKQQDAADALNSLGLFLGTEKGYELDNQLKRSDGIALLVRLLGKEEAAKSGKTAHPFNDVDSWLAPYVSYAYAEGLTKGVSETAYGTAKDMTRAQFYTLVLRALGYTDEGDGADFEWAQPYALAKEVGLTKSAVTYNSFSRGAAVQMFWRALNAKVKGTEKTLGDMLIADGVFTKAAFAEAAKIYENGRPVTEVPEGYMVNERTGHLLTLKQGYVDKVAYAYWDKHMDTDYELSSMAQCYAVTDANGLKIPNNRREIYSAPEWASSERRVYYDCSGFISAAHYQAFGEDVRDYVDWLSSSGAGTETMMAIAKANKTKDVIYYKALPDNATQADRDQTLADMLELLEPCDVIVYRRSTDSGHTIMYMDGGYTIESGGSSYNYSTGIDKVDANGTIRMRAGNLYRFDPKSSNYILANTAVNEVAILRPLNVIPLEPTARTLARMELGRLAIYKTALARGQMVEQGDQITFTITLDNEPENYEGHSNDRSKDLVLTVTDPLPTNVELVSVSDGGALVDGVITWKNLSVADGAVKKLTYTVKVAAASGKIVSGTSYVNGLDFIYHDIEIGTKMTAAQKSAFEAAVAAGKSADTDALAWVNSLYRSAVGKDLGVSTGEELFDQLCDPALDGDANCRYKMNIKTGSNVAKALVSNYFSGRYIFNASLQESIDRMRYIKEESLQYGDVIAERDYMNRYIYFIYLGEGRDMVQVSDDGVTTADTARTLESILTKRLFAVLRPSKI